jgi:uncharacterized protein GlcG (DUF336 family)
VSILNFRRHIQKPAWQHGTQKSGFPTFSQGANIMQQPTSRLLLIALAMGVSVSAWGQDEATFSSASLTPDSALKAAQAALKTCRDAGFNVAVAVADRSGVTQVMLRDRFAGAHTPQTAMGKAWTAASFRSNTTDLIALTQSGTPSAGIRQLPGVVVLGGGMPIESKGSLVGSIGISGARPVPMTIAAPRPGSMPSA